MEMKNEIEKINYVDWNDMLPVLQEAHKLKINTLIIGPKGTGKTSLVNTFATANNIPITSLNFSLHTRESHLIGSVQLKQNETLFNEGLLIKSMQQGGILYLDEINAAEADVLLRLDEALDDRRQLVLKENGGETIKARDDWFVVATMNPLSHLGTKELPPQILSRFPIRLAFDYPPKDVELQIIQAHVGQLTEQQKEQAISMIDIANILRQKHIEGELFYSPSLRETITATKLLVSGKLNAKQIAIAVFQNVYAQWNMTHEINSIIVSKFG